MHIPATITEGQHPTPASEKCLSTLYRTHKKAADASAFTTMLPRKRHEDALCQAIAVTSPTPRLVQAFHTFRCRDTGWVSSVAGDADVQGAAEAFVLNDGGWILPHTVFMVELSTQGKKAPFNILPTLLTYKASVDTWQREKGTYQYHGKNSPVPTLPAEKVIRAQFWIDSTMKM